MRLFKSATMLRDAALLAFVGNCLLTAVSARAEAPVATMTPKMTIETRQQGFKKMGAAMKAIVDELKTSAPDIAKLSAASEVLSTSAPLVPNWFPAGSGPQAGIETDALPFIWKDSAKFAATAKQLVEESKKLVVMTSQTDVAAIKLQAKAVGDTCSSCHRSFRAD